nr:FAD-binding domain-containing protein [Piscinibacter sakaiensis]
MAAVRPDAYARTRNALDGAVTRLSPYLTHGLLELPEVLAAVAARHPLGVQHKFVYELGWREYFHHVWAHRGDGILQSLHAGPLPDAAYAAEVPTDVREARSGVPVIDQAVRGLYAEGWLHNHARMWLASYLVHLRKVHWRAGADWLWGHLLDGDLASNHLSWQWVAGTGSHQPYLFNAGNVARHAPPHWHSPGSVLDTSYEALDALARDPLAVPATPAGEGVDEPGRDAAPGPSFAAQLEQGLAGPGAAAARGTPPVDPAAALAAAADAVRGREVWLAHPWALGDPPADLAPDTLVLAWWPVDVLSARPWSAARRDFAATRLAALSTQRWACDGATLGRLLAGARRVRTRGDPQLAGRLPASVQARPVPRLFAAVERPCPSFSAWWRRVTRGVHALDDLPGLAARLPDAATGRPAPGGSAP